jgi:Tfp pilus assembly pilus retraction ATPase PilT
MTSALTRWNPLRELEEFQNRISCRCLRSQDCICCASSRLTEGVRGLLRLDPDVLVLGEMRESLSARAALDAADSGHVFLSTLQARDAAGTLSVLRHFGLSDHDLYPSH